VASLPKGQPLRVASVNDHLVAVPPDPASWGLQQPMPFSCAHPCGDSGVNAKFGSLAMAGRTPDASFSLAAIQVASLLAHSLNARVLNSLSRMKQFARP